MPLKYRASKISRKIADQTFKQHLDPRASSSAARDYLKEKGFKVSSSKKGFLSSGATEKDVEGALDELAKAGKKFLSFKSRESAYKRNQGVRGTFREVEKLDEKDALQYFQLGSKGFQKCQQQQQQTADPNVEKISALQQKIEKYQKKLQGFKNVGSPQQTQRLQGLINKFTSQKLKMEDPSGGELRKFRYKEQSKTTGPANTYKTIGSQKTQKKPQNTSPLIDPLGDTGTDSAPPPKLAA